MQPDNKICWNFFFKCMESEPGVETPLWSIVPICRFCLKFRTETLLKETVHNMSGNHSEYTLIYSYNFPAVKSLSLHQGVFKRELCSRGKLQTTAHWTAAKNKLTAVKKIKKKAFGHLLRWRRRKLGRKKRGQRKRWVNTDTREKEQWKKKSTLYCRFTVCTSVSGRPKSFKEKSETFKCGHVTSRWDPYDAEQFNII